ncbi:MAG: ABC transporter substrate-binding protein, partial [Desulfuromonadales bacterium]|nr:ABC transporter substrate-binding protein [Desulfuromonadales bacterium]
MKKYFALLATLALTLFLVAGCSQEETKKAEPKAAEKTVEHEKAPAVTQQFAHEGTIKLGVAGPHSGDLAPYGIPAMKAAQLVVKQVNAKGGVLGKKVELLIQDDQCKPEIATNTATKLVTDGVDVVLG